MKIEAMWIITNLLFGQAEYIDIMLGIQPFEYGLASEKGYTVPDRVILGLIN